VKHARLARPGADAGAEHPRTARLDLQLPFGRDVAQALREQLRALSRTEIEIVPDECDVSEHCSRAPLSSDRKNGREAPHVLRRVVEDEAGFLDPAVGTERRGSNSNHAARELAVVRKESGEGQRIV